MVSMQKVLKKVGYLGLRQSLLSEPFNFNLKPLNSKPHTFSIPKPKPETLNPEP